MLVHVVTAMMLVLLGFFSTVRLAQRRLQKLSERGKTRFVGWAMLNGTMQKAYYCGPLFPSAWVEHEAELSMVLFNTKATTVLRRHVPYDCDTLLWINNHKYYMERERGTHNNKGLRKRLVKLNALIAAEPEAIILWICNDESGINHIRIQMAPILPSCLFTTYEEAMTPHDPVWIGMEGVKVALPKHVRPA